METASRPAAFEADSLPDPTEAPCSVPSEELDALFRMLVERAHEAVDRLAAQAAPAVSQLSAGLALFSEAASGSPRLSAEEPGDAPDFPPAPFSPEEMAERYFELVREHPVASLATAVAAGIVLGRMRTR